MLVCPKPRTWPSSWAKIAITSTRLQRVERVDRGVARAQPHARAAASRRRWPCPRRCRCCRRRCSAWPWLRLVVRTSLMPATGRVPLRDGRATGSSPTSTGSSRSSRASSGSTLAHAGAGRSDLVARRVVDRSTRVGCARRWTASRPLGADAASGAQTAGAPDSRSGRQRQAARSADRGVATKGARRISPLVGRHFR